MRILHIMTASGNGGAETYATDAMLALQEAGCVQTAFVSEAARRTPELAAHGIKVVTAQSRFRPWMRRQLKRLINDEKPDVIHAWMRRGGEICPEPTSIPVIGWLGGYYPPHAYRTTTHFISVAYDIDAHLAAAGVPPNRRFVVHTFPSLPDNPPPPASRRALDTPDDAPLLLALSRLHPHKALDTLLRALVEVPDAYLWIAGDGVLENDLKALAATLKVNQRVRFLGWRSDGAALLSACNVCVLPSRIEPFGTVIIEAWAARKPLVAAAAKGPMQYVRDNDTGLVVPIDDAPALAAALQRVLDDKELSQRLTRNGYSAYNAGFTKKASRDGLLNAYTAAQQGDLSPWYTRNKAFSS